MSARGADAAVLSEPEGGAAVGGSGVGAVGIREDHSGALGGAGEAFFDCGFAGSSAVAVGVVVHLEVCGGGDSSS